MKSGSSLDGAVLRGNAFSCVCALAQATPRPPVVTMDKPLVAVHASAAIESGALTVAPAATNIAIGKSESCVSGEAAEARLEDRSHRLVLDT